MISVLLYYFVAVCNPDSDLCERYPIADRWPGFVMSAGAYAVDGPFFSVADCDEARSTWDVQGTSACYAREIHHLMSVVN